MQKYAFKEANLKEHIQVDKKKQGKPDFSKPFGFYQKVHEGWDPANLTFNLKKMPKDVRDMLKKAGFKRKDLLNKELAIKIFSIIEEGTEIENLANH